MAVNIINKYVFLLTLVCVSVVENRIVKEEKLEEISEVFNEIEKNQQKLKTEFEAILTEEEELEIKEKQLERREEELKHRQEQNNKRTLGMRSSVILNDQSECNCVPYHLCSPETGMQVTDGTHLLEARVSICENSIEICCKKTAITGNRNVRESTSTTRKCGYGYQDDSNLGVASVDDPSLTTPGQYPWTVVITKDSQYACVGSLIHPRVVLTAAHCVNSSSRFFIRAGEWDAGSKAEQFKHQDRNVKDIIRHPDFHNDNLIYDAALLILDEEVEFIENINTICLTKPAPEPLMTTTDQCLATGWGQDRLNRSFSKKMRKIEFSLNTDDKCQDCLRTTRLGNKFVLHQSFVCAQGLHGSDACRGYGGAPLMCSISQQHNRYQLVGLVSWGLNCADPFTPTVFTKISQIRDWVDATFDMFGYSKDFYIE